MHIEVTFRNLQPRAEIKKRVEVLFGKLHKFLDPSSEAQMNVAIEHSVAVVEIHVTAHGHTHKVSDEDADMRTVVDRVFHKLENQLRRNKERVKDHKHTGRPEEVGFGESAPV